MEFTGERFVPNVRGDIELEHLHRYLKACEVAAGKAVLDIASGEGYGAAMLANRANSVIGVDISVEAVAHARERYKKNNLEFMVGDCANIPLQDACVDMVVSFETIEHHDQHEEMMREFKRVLRPAGILLISSPDKYHFSEEPGGRNPYHVKELYQHEFQQLIGNHFKNVAYFGQRVVRGSGIFAEALATPFACYWRENEVISESAGMARPMYWIALASDNQLPKLASGFFELSAKDANNPLARERIAAEPDGRIADLTRTVTERDGQIVSLTRAVGERDGHIDRLSQTVAAIYASRSWRVTEVLRIFRRWLSR